MVKVKEGRHNMVTGCTDEGGTAGIVMVSQRCLKDTTI